MNGWAIGFSVLCVSVAIATIFGIVFTLSEDTRSDILIGITSGLVTSLVLIPLTIIWSRGIVPWFEARVYSDASIKGLWKVTIVFGEFDDSEAVIDEFRMVLKQTAHRVTGTLTGISGPDAGKDFSLSGEYRNVLLTLTYASLDVQRLDRGAITLQLVNNGTKLVGTGAYYDNVEDKANWCRVRAVRATSDDFGGAESGRPGSAKVQPDGRAS